MDQDLEQTNPDQDSDSEFDLNFIFIYSLLDHDLDQILDRIWFKFYIHLSAPKNDHIHLRHDSHIDLNQDLDEELSLDHPLDLDWDLDWGLSWTLSLDLNHDLDHDLDTLSGFKFICPATKRAAFLLIFL